jgi:hypothetical protein
VTTDDAPRDETAEVEVPMTGSLGLQLGLSRRARGLDPTTANARRTGRARVRVVRRRVAEAHTEPRLMRASVTRSTAPNGAPSALMLEQKPSLFGRCDMIDGCPEEIQRNLLGERDLALPKEPA